MTSNKHRRYIITLETVKTPTANMDYYMLKEFLFSAPDMQIISLYEKDKFPMKNHYKLIAKNTNFDVIKKLKHLLEERCPYGIFVNNDGLLL